MQEAGCRMKSGGRRDAEKEVVWLGERSFNAEAQRLAERVRRKRGEAAAGAASASAFPSRSLRTKKGGSRVFGDLHCGTEFGGR